MQSKYSSKVLPSYLVRNRRTEFDGKCSLKQMATVENDNHSVKNGLYCIKNHSILETL